MQLQVLKNEMAKAVRVATKRAQSADQFFQVHWHRTFIPFRVPELAAVDSDYGDCARGDDAKGSRCEGKVNRRRPH